MLALELRATSADGARAGVRLVPWSVSVPHTEVVFETGKSDIRPSEEPKLDAIYQRVADEVTKARKRVPDVPVKLYIAGYTDTVGSNADNRKLSTARAKPSPRWFRNRGLPLPIVYAGFGEEVLTRQDARRDRQRGQPPRRLHHRVRRADDRARRSRDLAEGAVS